MTNDDDRRAAELTRRLSEMDAAIGLRKECLERATYLLALAPESLSTIERQSMSTLFSAADELLAAERRGMERAAGICDRYASDAWGMTEEAHAANALAAAIRAEINEGG